MVKNVVTCWRVDNSDGSSITNGVYVSLWRDKVAGSTFKRWATVSYLLDCSTAWWNVVVHGTATKVKSFTVLCIYINFPNNIQKIWRRQPWKLLGKIMKNLYKIESIIMSNLSFIHNVFKMCLLQRRMWERVFPPFPHIRVHFLFGIILSLWHHYYHLFTGDFVLAVNWEVLNWCLSLCWF